METFIIVDIGTVIVFFLIILFLCIGAGESMAQYIQNNSEEIATIFMSISAIVSFISFCINISYIKKKLKKTRKNISVSHIFSCIGIFLMQAALPSSLLFYFKEVLLYWDRLKTSFWVFFLFVIPFIFLMLGLMGLIGVLFLPFGLDMILKDAGINEKPGRAFGICFVLFIVASLVINLLSLWISHFWR